MQDAIVISGKTIRAFIVGMTNKLNIDFLIRLAGRFLMNGSQFGTNRPPTVTHPVHHGVAAGSKGINLMAVDIKPSIFLILTRNAGRRQEHSEHQ
jgi:hypothetical protein